MPATLPTTELITIRVPRTIDASPEAVFDAWADPERFAKWFQTKRSIFRPAAVDTLWYWVAEHLGRDWPHYCRYTRVERPRLLEFAWVSEATQGHESRVTLDIQAKDGGTELVLTHSGIPDDEMGRSHEEGWTQILATLGEKIGGVR